MTESEITSHGEKRRPYWHVDAKWISGLLGLAALSATLLSLVLFHITSERTAVPLAAEALAAAFSPPGQGGNEASIASLQAQIETSEDGVFYPFPGVDVGVTAEDLQNDSFDDLRERLFTGLAEEIYWTGLESMPDGSQESAWSRVGFMALLTHETHVLIRRALLVSGAISALFIALLAFFSHRSGRVASPGCALTLAGLPGTLLFGALMDVVSNPQGRAMETGGDRIMGAVAALQPAVEAALRTYMWASAAGLLLLVAGLVAAIIGRLRSPSPS